jgi:uncharacterized protein with ATP-grasp and redox domains
VSTTLGLDTDVDDAEVVLAGDENALVHLQAEDLRLEEAERLAIDANEATTLLSVCDRSGSLVIDGYVVNQTVSRSNSLQRHAFFLPNV